MIIKSRNYVEVPEARTPPLLKWAGGKRNLVDLILPLVPSRFNRYFEPFFGGGALFFALQSNKAHLSDKNTELMHAYTQVRDQPDAVIRELRKLRNSKKDYYKIRSSIPKGDAARAARLIYLVTLAFRNASKLLKVAAIRDEDFEKAVSQAGEGDLVYLDPPYTVAHGNNGFIKYNAKIFSWEDQIRLSLVAKELVGKGCIVIVSNADHPSIRSLYDGFMATTLERNSIIAASSDFRSRITECVFHAGGKLKC